MKELVVQDAPKQIKHIQFGVLSPQEIVNIAELEVTHRDCYATLADGSRGPAVNGALDPRMGVSNKKTLCKTCGLKMVDCVGHYGYIKLVLPVFHIGFFKHTITMLQTVCKSCACVLLTEEDRRKYLRIFRRKNLENLTRSRTIKLVNMAARKVTNCPRCGAINGTVKKAGALKVVHEPYRAKKFADEKKEFHNTFDTAVRMAKASGPATADLKPHLDRAQDDLNPLKVLELFKRISDEDCELLGLRPEFGRPEEYIWQYICVPPVCIRPSVQQEAGTNEDDITVKLNEIVFANQLIRAALQKGGKGATTNQLMEQWDFLQLSVGLYIHSEMPGQNQPTKKPGRGFCQRLKGKQGRFRGNLSGKRVDFSGRTVISPDPNLKIDELAVPERVAKILTYPERVNNHNLESLRIAVRNGNEVHPGANYVIDEVTGFKKFLRPKFAAAEAERLKVGDIVERHLKDGDIVLFNRQPSLHKLSIMSHRVKVRPWRTFRLNECACNPYNADFDGDEMNVHVPQTEEARTEATVLMGVKHNLVTPRNGEPLVAAIQDFITASFLISRRDRFFTRAQFTQACSYFADATQQIDIPSPAIHKPVRLWTGKQLFNCLIRPNHDSPVRVNLEAQCRTFEKPSDDPPMPGAAPYIKDMSPNDGWLVIQNSEVMCGVMDKSTVGDGKKNSLFGVILRDYGSDAAIVSMNRLAKTCARWLANQGFSLGINDVMPGEELRATKDSKVERAYAECLDLIEKAKKGKLDNLPGCDQEQTLENMISGVLSAVRAAVGEICMTELSRHNAPLIMAVSGSKGSKINVAQMVACVGQQIIAGSRVPNGFQDRSLPHFPKKSKDPPSKGFVRNSFFSGLTPTEFLFHAISGREGLVDTAVKTAETGYMQRRLMKALEDLSTHYDLSVRNSVGGVVQFEYGNDGLDPAELEGDGTPVEYRRTWRNAIALTLYQEGAGLLPYEIMEMCEAELVRPVGPPSMIDPVTGQPSRIPPPPTAPQKRFDACDPQFCEDTLKFVRESVVEPAAAIRNAHGMYPALTRPDHGNVNLMEGVDAAGIAIVDNKTKIKKVAVQAFLDMCYSKYMRSKVEPGTAVGAVGAQSIGEPGTQMTLKTFHFAGVASMNVTLGVPRIKEIINAAKLINTPIITAKLVNNETERAARIVKGRIEKTYLGDIASVLEEAWAASYVYIGIHIDMDAVRRLQLELTLDDIKIALVRAPKLKIKMEHITVVPKKNRLRIQIHGGGDKEIYYALKTVKRALPSIVVKGIKEATRAVISVDREAMDDEDQRRKLVVKQQLEAGKTPETFEDMPDMKGLLVEGYGLREVMNTDGVIGTQTKTNHIMEMHQVLGIEASRQTIFNEINHTMGAHGMSIDPRHVRLLADVMTYKGEVLGITRFGVAKMKDSVLMLASFEKTTDHLFDAALFGKTDAIQGVSESIIMGNPAGTVGTGMPALVTPKPYCPPRRELIFDRDFD